MNAEATNEFGLITPFSWDYHQLCCAAGSGQVCTTLMYAADMGATEAVRILLEIWCIGKH